MIAPEVETSPGDGTKHLGLLPKFEVKRASGHPGKPGDEFFVLNYGRDRIARVALAAYADEAERQGYGPLAADLRARLRFLDDDDHGVFS